MASQSMFASKACFAVKWNGKDLDDRVDGFSSRIEGSRFGEKGELGWKGRKKRRGRKQKTGQQSHGGGYWKVIHFPTLFDGEAIARSSCD